MAIERYHILVFILSLCGGLIDANYSKQDHGNSRDMARTENLKSKRFLTNLCTSFFPIFNVSLPDTLLITIEFNSFCENLSVIFQSIRFSVLIKSKEKDWGKNLRSIRCNCRSKRPCERSYNLQDFIQKEQGYFVTVRLACERVCDSCSGIQYRVLPIRKMTTVVNTYSTTTVIIPAKMTDQVNNKIYLYLVVAFGFWIFVGVSACACVLVYRKFQRPSSDVYFENNNHQLSDLMHRYNKKKILFIDFPFKQFSILVDILNEFEMLEVVDIRLCYKDIQNNYKCWVRNITRSYDGILIAVTKQLNELIQKQCDKSQSWIEVTQCYIPIITHLIKHLDEHQCADFEKYVINFDGSSNTQDFLNRFTTFRNGKIFSLVSLHEHFVKSTLEKDVLLKYLVLSMMSNMNIKNKDDVIITALRNINTKYSEYEL